jgi:tripartite ATP-independent transporter DctP family solute receptor
MSSPQRRQVLAGLAGSAAMAIGPARAAPLELKFPHVGTPSSSYHLAATKFGELLKQATNGNANVTVIPGGQMGDQQDLLAGLRLGTIDFYTNDVGTMAFQDAGKDFNAMWVPYLFKDMGHFRRFLGSPVYQRMLDAYESRSGIKVIGYLLDRSPRQITTAATAVRKPEDLRGVKIRVPQLPTLLASFKAWGANATVMPWIEAVNALRQRVIDGQDNGIDLITAFKLWESQKYFIKTDHVLNGIVLFTSAQKWRRWPDNVKTAMTSSVAGTYEALNAGFWESEGKGIADMRAGGMEIIEPDQTPFRDIALQEARKLDGELWRKGLLDEILTVN